MKNTRWTIIAALFIAATSVAHAQAPVPPGSFPGASGSFPGASGSAPGATGATADSGAISNAQSTETTTTTTSSTGIGPDGVSVEVDPAMDSSMETTELANTGGEPVLMALVGLSMALGAFAVRKRVSA